MRQLKNSLRRIGQREIRPAYQPHNRRRLCFAIYLTLLHDWRQPER